MNTLSKEKLNYQKAKKRLTNQKISQLTNIPISNIDKIFSGTNKNPTLDTIQKIASVLDCSIDDFIEYENPPVEPCYINLETKKIVDAMEENNDLKNIFDSLVRLDKKDVELLLKLTKRFDR